MLKVTRLRSGNRIHCSDSELEALRRLTELGLPLVQGKSNKGNVADLPSRAKSAIRSRRFNQAGGPLATTDDDRRAE